MKVFKIDITSWTASFKYPNLISGYQPTLEVPPISTVLGLMNAASGTYLQHKQLKIGYYFEFGAKQVDLETIYQIEGHEKGFPKGTAKSNVINREFLYTNHLQIYLEDEALAELFRAPVYPLLLGRSNDLATVNKVEKLELNFIPKAEKIKGQLIPLQGNYLPGMIQALPKYFTDTIPRKNLGTEAYSVIRFDAPDKPTLLPSLVDYTEKGQEVHIYLHELDFRSYHE